MCLEVFVEGRPEHVLEMVTLEVHIEEVVVLDVPKLTLRVYVHHLC